MTYSNINQEMDDLVGLTGSESWDELMAWFGGMTQAEIEAECDRIWCQQDNSTLAARIHNAIEVTQWQR